MKETAMPGPTLTLFGPPRLLHNGQRVRLRSRKCLALLAYLSIKDVTLSRNELETLLYPESDATRAQNSMRATLSWLKSALQGAWLVVDRDTIGLDGSHRLAIDVVRFRDLLAQCWTHSHLIDETCPECWPLLEEAVALYGGDFLAGFTLRDSPQFDEWQLFEAESLRRELASTLERLAGAFADQGDADRALACVQRWVAMDPLHEPAHRSLMRLYAESGRRSEALRQYETCRRLLEEELGVPPDPVTAALCNSIRQQRDLLAQGIPPMPSWKPSSAPTVTIRHNLPLQPTPFVGRKEELAQIHGLLANPACRLLTVVGAGGMGKTRLAIQAGKEQLRRFDGAVVFVALASLGSSDLLAPTIIEALGIYRHDSIDPETQLLNTLRDRGVLLVLDNFEHLLEGTDLVARMLEDAPRLKVLVTSRERLNLREEWLFELLGMESPGDEEIARAGESERDLPDAPLSLLESYSAVELFVQSARRVRRDFSLAIAGAAAVARICRLVEGMPLAIELAVPWIRVMSCQDIVQEIERSVGFLATTLRDMPPRHRSMHAVFDHSWELLSSGERKVMERLSVFRGGFRWQAAGTVARASLSVLSGLVDSSWLRTTPSGRYEIHELIRQYADGHLEEDCGDADQVRDLHSRYYVSFLQQRGQRAFREGQARALQEILEDMDNIWAAWWRAVNQGDVESIGSPSLMLWFVAEAQGWYHETRQAFEAALARVREQLEPADCDRVREAAGLVLADLLVRQAAMCGRTGTSEQAIALCEEGLARLRDVKPGTRRTQVEGATRIELGALLRRAGDPRAEQLHREALALAEGTGDPWRKEAALWQLGQHAALEARFAEAEELYRQAIAAADELGEQWMKSAVLVDLAHVLWEKGEYLKAEGFAEESLRIRQEFGERSWIGGSWSCLGEIAIVLGKYEEAAQHFQKSLAIAEETGKSSMRVDSLRGQGSLAMALGQYEQAKGLFEEGLANARNIDLRLTVQIGLGHAVCALGETQQARACFLQALGSAMAAHRPPAVLSALVGVAFLSATEGNGRLAVELLVLALHSPATCQIDRDRAQELLAELESELPPEVLAVATARGQARKVEATSSQILAQLESAPEGT
jgi:predicted ATPase/DNA-binding SARP family transcriptional activator